MSENPEITLINHICQKANILTWPLKKRPISIMADLISESVWNEKGCLDLF